MNFVETQLQHENRIRVEELRQGDGTRRYVDTPHLIASHSDAMPPFDWDAGSFYTVGHEPLPLWAPPYWSLPAGVWTARLLVSGQAEPPFDRQWRSRVRVRLLADSDIGATPPRHEFIQDLTTTYDGQTELLAGEIRGEVETAPLVSDGTLFLWADAVTLIGGGAVTLHAATRMIFGRLA